MERYKREYFGDPKNMPADLLIEALKATYTPEPVPTCRVCGGNLSISSIGGGSRTIYACSPYETDPENPDNIRLKADRTIVDDHYPASRWEQVFESDPRIHELISRYMKLLESA